MVLEIQSIDFCAERETRRNRNVEIETKNKSKKKSRQRTLNTKKKGREPEETTIVAYICIGKLKETRMPSLFVLQYVY